MEDFRKLIGERLKYLRTKSVNYSTAASIAKKLNVDASTYYGWEQGRREPSSKYLSMLADLHNTNIDFIVGKSEEESPSAVNIKEILEKNKLTYGDIEINESQAAQFSEIMKVILGIKK